MDSTIALTAAAVVLVLIIVLLSFLKKQFDQKPQEANELAPVQDAIAGPRRAPAVRNRPGLRNRLADRQRLRNEVEDDVDDNGAVLGDSEEEASSSLIDLGDQKVGKKKMAKLEAKAEKAKMREAEEREREEKKAKELERMEERKKQEEQEEQLEKEREEQAKREAEEKARREHEEYLKMKAAFTIEEQGFDAAEESAQGDLLQRFVTYVKETKIVLLEELAANFQLKTQDAIDRLQKLVADGTLTGVIDDRGKFIYITREEMEAVAKFIRQRGRVSLADIAESSNQLIQLGGKTQPVETTSS